METNRLFYKKNKAQIEAKDYIDWAFSMLKNNYSSPTLNMLAFLKEPLNMFEAEQYFNRTVDELNLTEPPLEVQINAQTQYLLQQIITNKEYAIDNAYELYKIYRDNFGYEEDKTILWLYLTDMDGDLEYGDNINKYTKESIEQSIVQAAKEQLSNNK